MPERPYIGVTGPTNITEVQHLVGSFGNSGITLKSSHQPMIGFLVSEGTLNGLPDSNRRYPRFEDLPALLDATKGQSFTTIHYRADRTNDLSEQIHHLFGGKISSLARGLQLNFPIPDTALPPIREMAQIHDKFPDLKVILQLSPTILYRQSPEELVRMLSGYGELIHYALLDPSEGRGQSFEPAEVLEYYFALRSGLPGLSLGLAGGFTGDNIAERFSALFGLGVSGNVCVDAEGGLRDKLSNGDDLLNLSKASNYITQAASVLI